MYTHISVAGPAPAPTDTAGERSPSGFRAWEAGKLTEIPVLTKKMRETPATPLPKNPRIGDLWRSERTAVRWVLHWKYVRTKKWGPRSTCKKESVWCYDPTKYAELLEKFKSESAAAETAASGTGAAASPTRSSAGVGECSNGASLDLETFSQRPLLLANGAVGSTAASVASPAPSAASAAMDATTLYKRLRDAGRLPLRGSATEHGPKKKNCQDERYYYISGKPHPWFELYISSEEIDARQAFPCLRGWKRPPNIYKYNPSA